jgi:hypothetical protein
MKDVFKNIFIIKKCDTCIQEKLNTVIYDSERNYILFPKNLELHEECIISANLIYRIYKEK